MENGRDGEARAARSDAELLERIADGDGPAFAELATRLAPALRRVLFRFGLSEAEAEDVLQETLIRVWRGSPGFRARSSVSSWANSSPRTSPPQELRHEWQ